jgi:hypothetical protein
MNTKSDTTEVPLDLMAENSEAEKFVQSVFADLDRFKLFPGEHFVKVVGNVLSATSIDRQGESLPVSDLEALVTAVEERDFWLRREHDSLIHPIGRVIAAKMFHAPQSDVYFVTGIVGFYDSSSLPTFLSKGIDPLKLMASSEANTECQADFARAHVEFNPYEIPYSEVEDMLEKAPDSVEREVVEHYRKSAFSIAVLHISASIWLLSNTPFGKKFQERLGEKAADASVEFLKWIADIVAGKLRQVAGRNTRLVISIRYRGCDIEFVLKGTEGPVATVEAMQSLEAAANQSLLLVDALSSTEPRRVTYGYDVASKTWFPLHASTLKEGIITDQPYMIALENLGGFSVGGRRLPISSEEDGCD